MEKIVISGLERSIFETSRAAEYFSARELQAQTGQPMSRFAAAALKELVDNALDACETAGVSPVIEMDVARMNGHLHLSVTDNGSGLNPDTVRRILNFETRISDKSAYRAPTRGTQGNALKTVLGMPWALGVDEPVVMEADSARHRIQAWVDPAGELRIAHDIEDVPLQPGTRVELTLPSEGQELSPLHWARAFALFNPHASVRIRTFDQGSEHGNSCNSKTANSRQPTVSFPDDWRKFLPTDLTSPWWYSVGDLERLLFAHIADVRRGGKDPTLRDLVRQFRGLSGSAKAKTVCDRFPTIDRLTDFEADPGAVADLLGAMQAATRPPSPGVLGLVGPEHLRTCFENSYGVKQFWYGKKACRLDNIPFVFEAALAETEKDGDLYFGLNFSPINQDPLSEMLLEGPEFASHGMLDFLKQGHASPIALREDEWADRLTCTAVAVHLVCPALEFLDRGKSRLQLPNEMVEAISRVLWSVVKDLYREVEKRRRNAARAERAYFRELDAMQWTQTWTLKEAVFEVLTDALDQATGSGQYPVSARTLYYQVRPLVQRYTDIELRYGYFSQDLLTQYRELGGPLDGLYYDPRGLLYEPHTGEAIPLGTREVDDYSFPPWLYDKILYVEKRGLWPILEKARLAERYDMAIIAAEGYATEAARTLFERADKNRNYRLFVLHDADPHGYNIARTLREATRRMPGYQVDVVDLGLNLAQALQMKLQVETFTRRKALPEGLVLTDLEREHFEGRRGQSGSWVCGRIELNALTAPALVEYIEHKLVQAGAADKVIPTADELPDLVEELCRDQVGSWVDAELARLLVLNAIKHHLADAFIAGADLTQAREWIQAAFEADGTLTWRAALSGKACKLISEADLQPDLRVQLSESLARLSEWR